MPYHKATNFTSKGVRLPGLFLQLPRAQDWGEHLLCIFWGKVGGFCHDPELLSQKCHRTQWQLSRQLLPQYPTSHHWAHISSVETPLELTRCQKACSSSNNSQTVFGRSLGMKTLIEVLCQNPFFTSVIVKTLVPWRLSQYLQLSEADNSLFVSCDSDPWVQNILLWGCVNGAYPLGGCGHQGYHTLCC